MNSKEIIIRKIEITHVFCETNYGTRYHEKKIQFMNNSILSEDFNLYCEINMEACISMINFLVLFCVGYVEG